MKNFLKKIRYTVVITLIVIGSVYSLKTFAAESTNNNTDIYRTNIISPLIHRGGGHQYVEGVFDIAESVGAMFGATSPNGKSAVFDEPSDGGGTFFAVLDDSWIGGRLFVGIPRDQVNGFSYSESLASNNPWSSGVQFGDMGNFFSATLQRVNVGGANGNVLATNLIHQGSSDNVCIDPKGSLVICTNFSCLNQPQHASRCDSVTLTEDTNSTLSDPCDSSVACSFGCDSNYHYDSGTNSCVLNTCTGTIPAHATLCTNDDTGLSENVARVLTSTCSSPVGSTPKCEYVCDTNAGYFYNNGICSNSIDGSCDTSVVNGCSTGTLNDINDSSTQYLWECVGLGGGTTASCAKDIPQTAVNGSCHNYAGTYDPQPATDTATGCDAGTYVDDSDNPATDTYWDWHCEGLNGGTTENCQALITQYVWSAKYWGQCGSATEASCNGSWTTNGTGACVGDGIIYGPEEDPYGCNGPCGPESDEICSDNTTPQDCTSFSNAINNNGGVGSCSWDTSVENHNCSDSSPANKNICEAQNGGNTCTWVDAQSSTRTRPVYCIIEGSNPEQIVSSSKCDVSTRPVDTEDCVNGRCPNPDDLNYNSSASCIAGTFSNVQQIPCSGSGSNGSTWTCLGSNGGSNALCITPTCFLPDTLVTMADGTTKNIQDVKVGEKVIGRNGEISPVLKLHQPFIRESSGGNKVYAFNGGRFFVTAEHPFLTTKGWKAIDPVISMEKHPEISSIAHLKIGDILITNHGKVVLTSIRSKEVDPSTKVYNLILGGNHTYIADGYIVHNTKCQSNGGGGGGGSSSSNSGCSGCGGNEHCCDDGLCYPTDQACPDTTSEGQQEDL